MQGKELGCILTVRERIRLQERWRSLLPSSKGYIKVVYTCITCMLPGMPITGFTSRLKSGLAF